MKKELRMVAKSPDPDDLASEELPKPEQNPDDSRKSVLQQPNPDRSAPHIPPTDR